MLSTARDFSPKASRLPAAGRDIARTAENQAMKVYTNINNSRLDGVCRPRPCGRTCAFRGAGARPRRSREPRRLGADREDARRPDQRIALKPGWKVAGVAKASLDDIKPGDFVGVVVPGTAGRLARSKCWSFRPRLKGAAKAASRGI